MRFDIIYYIYVQNRIYTYINILKEYIIQTNDLLFKTHLPNTYIFISIYTLSLLGYMHVLVLESLVSIFLPNNV